MESAPPFDRPAKTLENKAQIVSQVSDLKSDMQ